MKAALSLTAICMLATAGLSASYEEIEDLSNLPLLNSDLKERQTGKIRLSNGLEALLISDPNADQSAAALAVNAGSWHDPDEYPGMAHFCEHMLFMGTKPFPKENEFSSMIADYNGQLNAYTAPDRTVYMFASSHDGFSPLLERFSRFFIDPLFNPSGISRELHAVDQEFSKNIENDGWREYMIFKETGNPAHPNGKFSTGNSETLGSIPQSALQNWHATYYSAEKMRLVLYAPASLEELAETAAALFAPVPVRPSAPSMSKEEITSEKQRGHLIWIQPIKQRQTLSLCWEVPPHLSQHPSMPAQLYSYALSRGQSFSLYELLKKEGLIEDASVSVEDLGGAAHRLFQIQLELTDKGLAEWKTAAMHCFQAIHKLRTNDIPLFLFQEMNDTACLKYQYQSRQSAFSFTMHLADALLDEDLATFPRTELLASSYEPETLAQFGRFLTPQNCLFTLMADSAKTKISPDAHERWMGGEYAIREIPKQQLMAWQDAPLHPELRIPDPNPFIPTSFAILAEEEGENPVRISQDAFGTAYYARANEFQSPEACLSLHLLTPKICGGAKQASLANLYLEILDNHLHPTLAAADSAGLTARFSFDRNRIHLQIEGFSDKAPFLLQEILKKIGSPLDVTKEEFETCKSKHRKKYANGAFDLPCIQARELALSLMDSDRKTRKEKLAALEKIGYAEFLSFAHSLFEESYIEALFAGNLSQKDAETAWLDVRHLIKSKPFPRKKQPQTKILALSSSGPYSIYETADVLGNASFLLLDQGSFSCERRAAQEILSAALEESFYDTLRTKQKTGYIVQSDNLEMEFRLFQYFMVQSNSHEPDELLQRFELFLETALQGLPEMISEERFATLKGSVTELLKSQGKRNMKEKSALLNKLAFELDADFSWIEKRLAGFGNLTYDAFLKEAKGFLSRENRKRLAILVEGKKKSRFAYEPISLEQIQKNERYLSRSEILNQ